MQRILELWETLWRYVRCQKSASTTVSGALSNPTASTLPASKHQSPKKVAEEEYVNTPLLLTAPDSYFKEPPSTLGSQEGCTASQDLLDLAKLEYFRQERIEVPLQNTTGWRKFPRGTSEIKRIDAAHADLSLEILLLQANTKLQLEEYCAPPPVYRVEQAPIPLRCVSPTLGAAETCAAQLRVAKVMYSHERLHTSQPVYMVPVSSVIFREVAYLRGWVVTTEHIPRPSHPMLIPSHQIFDVQPTRRRLEYAPPLPPLELDYSFGMDAGRTSFVEQLRIVKSRKLQTT